MAWNRPTERELGRGNRERETGKFPFRGLVAGAIVVFGAAVAAWWLWPTKESAGETPTPQTKQRIKEVTPAPAPKAEQAQRPSEKKAKTDADRLKEIRDLYGDNIPERLKTVVYFLEHPVKQSFKESKPAYRIFKHSSENDIASILVIEPGCSFLQKPFFDEDFDRDFKKSLNEKIEYTKDDTEEQRELKQAVDDTKREIAERMRAGEKPSDVLNAAVDQLYELGVYKAQLEETLNEFYESERYTDKDIVDFVTAAKEMLEKQGAEPLRMPNFTMRQAKLNFLARKRMQEESTVKENNE